MTTIKLALNDQRLFALNKVTLASGDINSVQLEVEFCEAWADYPVRFAHFAVQTANRLILSSETDAIPDVLMIDNKAIVPATALAESGVLYVGVYGDNLDGTARKTSIGEVKFIIHKGASGAKTTIAPETDAFMQYLAAMDNKIDPLMKAAVEQMQNTMAAQYKTFTDKVAADLEEFKNQYVEGVVLWETENIANTATPSKVEVDLTSYSKFTVIIQNVIESSVKDGNTGKPICSYATETYGELRKNIKYNILVSNSGNVRKDGYITFEDDGIKFNRDYDSEMGSVHGYYETSWGATGAVKVIGYKTPVVEVPDFEFE